MGCLFKTPLLKPLGICMEAEAERFKDPKVVDDFKHPDSPRHNRSDELMEPVIACANLHKFKSHKIPTIEKRK